MGYQISTKDVKARVPFAFCTLYALCLGGVGAIADNGGGGRCGRASENGSVLLHSAQEISRGHFSWVVAGLGLGHTLLSAGAAWGGWVSIG